MIKNTFQQKKQKGFTIIEVVLVLAIAGLIFLIVFLALPQLQESRRDTQRRNDAGRILSALESYASSNDGVYPTNAAGADSAVETYAGEIADPSTGAYAFTDLDVTASSGTGTIQYAPGEVCSGTGTAAGNARDIAIVMKLENGLYCRDNS